MRRPTIKTKVISIQVQTEQEALPEPKMNKRALSEKQQESNNQEEVKAAKAAAAPVHASQDQPYLNVAPPQNYVGTELAVPSRSDSAERELEQERIYRRAQLQFGTKRGVNKSIQSNKDSKTRTSN